MGSNNSSYADPSYNQSNSGATNPLGGQMSGPVTWESLQQQFPNGIPQLPNTTLSGGSGSNWNSSMQYTPSNGSYPANMTQYNRDNSSAPFSVQGAPWGFNEQYYLQQNPDVAAAIQAGNFTSGLQHYQMYGNQEGRSPAYGVTTPDPNRIPYSTTDPYAVNPYLNMNIQQQYSIPDPIGIGPWSQGSSMAGQDIWQPTSYVAQLDAMRRAQAMQNVQGLYNPAPATADTSPTDSSLNAAPVHANTAGWAPSDVNATLPTQANIGDVASPYIQSVTKERLRGRRPEGMRGVQTKSNWMFPGDMSNYSIGGNIYSQFRGRQEDPRKPKGLF